MQSKPMIIIVSGPSGVGKGEIIKYYRAHNKACYSVSYTTREMRYYEKDGVDYNFISKDEFEKLIENDALVEWTEYCDQFYGSPKEPTYSNIANGNDAIFEVEVNGALAIKAKHPQAVTVFILPPNQKELLERLRGRKTNREDDIEKRIKKAQWEMSMADKYDYQIVNDVLEEAQQQFCDIIEQARRLTTI